MKRFVHLRFDDGQKDWDHSAAIEVGEIVAVALAAIEHLPRRTKQVAILHWFHHRTRTEIATKMGTSTKTVEKQLAAARRALRKEVHIKPILP